MENIEKETVSSKFMENPYIEMKKKISVNGIVALVIAILAFVVSSAVSDPQSSLKLFDCVGCGTPYIWIDKSCSGE